MPHLRHATPTYRKHKPSGQAVVTLSSKVHYLGPWKLTASRVEYDRLIGEWLAGHRRPLDDRPSDVTVGALILAFWKHAKQEYVKHGRPTGTAENFRSVLRLLRKRYGKRSVRKFRPRALKAVRKQMIELGWSRVYINNNVDRIRQMFRWGVEEELVPVRIFQALAAVSNLRKGSGKARETPRIPPISDDVVDRTLPHMSPIVADMVRLQRLSGARPGEICILRPADVDTSGEVWLYTPAEHKTEHHDRVRMIALGPAAQTVLQPYLERDKDAFCFSPAEAEQLRRQLQRKRRKTKVQPSQVDRSKAKPRCKSGVRYTNDSYRRAIHRACDLAFPPPDSMPDVERAKWHSGHRWSPNRLRHSAATEIRKRFGLEAVQVTLGHSSARVSEIYAERDNALAAEVMRNMG